jgi:hypothetical protein
MSTRIRFLAIALLVCLLAGCPVQVRSFTIRAVNNSPGSTLTGIYIAKGATVPEYITDNLLSESLLAGQSVEIRVRLSEAERGEGIAQTYSYGGTMPSSYALLQVPFEAGMVITVTAGGTPEAPTSTILVEQASFVSNG